MKVKCKNCVPVEGIILPNFNNIEKNLLVEFKRESPINGVKHLVNKYKLDPTQSKYIITHINPIFGKCNRCKFNDLNEGNINCPICKSLNLNWNSKND